jgi:LmbE family N-acetylglucosaminyl deacetylase
MIVLSIGAHPDDEIYAAGMLAKYASEGHDVYILTTTRGEGGPLGDPPLTDRAGLAALRMAEGRAAGEILGAREVRYLPFVDPLMGPGGQWHAIDASLEDFSAAVAAVLAELRPEIVITHGAEGEYGHPQHKFTHRAVFAALRQLRPWTPREVLTWEATFSNAGPERKLNQQDPADIVLDISPWFAQKVAATEAHRSQWPAFLGNHPGKTIAEITDRVESFRRWTPEEIERSSPTNDAE